MTVYCHLVSVPCIWICICICICENAIVARLGNLERRKGKSIKKNYLILLLLRLAFFKDTEGDLFHWLDMIIFSTSNWSSVTKSLCLLESCKLLSWIENYAFHLLCISFFFPLQKIATMAHKHGALVLVDNSILSPVLSQPLELGAGIKNISQLQCSGISILLWILLTQVFDCRHCYALGYQIYCWT